MPEIIKQCYRDKTGQGSRHLFRFIMLILLAESKTMSSQEMEVSSELFNNNRPPLEDIADSLMQYVENLTPLQIGDILGISPQLATKAHNYAFEFPNKSSGYKAIHGFTGEAFKALSADTLSSQALENADKNLKIISSVYGILNPSDIVKPYRNEFNKQIFPDDKTPIQVFKPKVTIELVNYIKKNNIKEIINLLPGDADKCIDWKIVRAFTKTYKIQFQSLENTGRLKTPIAKHLKELRGKMARQILMEGISTFQELIQSESEDYIYSPQHSKPMLPIFLAE